MLYLVTGTPGSGKTQWVIDFVRSNKQFEGRPIWYWGIPELSDSLGWHRLGSDTFDLDAAANWADEIPDGAVFVVDEAHKVWPSIGGGKSAHQKGYAELGTSRHRGWTIIAITQYPAHVDTAYRGRVERHWHLERKLGRGRTLVIEFEQIGNPKNKSEREGALSRTFYKFNPEVWKLYKSATVHNVEKKPIPKKIWMIPVLLVALVALLRWVWYTLHDGGLATMLKTGEVAGVEYSPEAASAGSMALAFPAGNYAFERSERIKGQPWTAPIYDDVRKVSSYPRPQCISSVQDGETRCSCYTQQASKMRVSKEFCLGVVRLGYFDPAVPDQYLTQPERERSRLIVPRESGPTWNLRPYDYDPNEGPTIDVEGARDRVERMRKS